MASKKKKSRKSRSRRGTRRSARIAALNHARCNRAGSPVPGEPTRAMPTENLTLRTPPPPPNQEAIAINADEEPTQSDTLPVVVNDDEEYRWLNEYMREFYDDIPHESESAPPPAEVVDDNAGFETRSSSPSPLDDGLYDESPMHVVVEYDGSWVDLPGLDYGSQQHETDLAITLGLNCAYNDPSIDLITDIFNELMEF